jgi:hypothetical protein
MMEPAALDRVVAEPPGVGSRIVDPARDHDAVYCSCPGTLQPSPGGAETAMGRRDGGRARTLCDVRHIFKGTDAGAKAALRGAGKFSSSPIEKAGRSVPSVQIYTDGDFGRSVRRSRWCHLAPTGISASPLKGSSYRQGLGIPPRGLAVAARDWFGVL